MRAKGQSLLSEDFTDAGIAESHWKVDEAFRSRVAFLPGLLRLRRTSSSRPA